LWNWGYWRSRYQIKSIFYICQKLNIPLRGYDLKDRSKIAFGNQFPEEIIKSIPITITWYPEDYIDLKSQSVQAKEIEETEQVRSYIKSEGYIDSIIGCQKK
ncbi:hypothetical protein R0J91_14560, partial [Micrococcus sp. SIMBA_131]